MIPKFLSFQAFGSYVNKQDIDFEKLNKGEIFLIEGKTGSGKTTIIDAIVFALYGSGSGEGRDDFEKMRCCSESAKDLDTFVEFTFEANNTTYKFVRKFSTTAQLKKDRDKVLASAFEIQKGVEVPLLSNPTIRQVNELAVKIIGLNREQFTKVMVLPQGKFESFLVADSAEKEVILKTLFNAEKWKEIVEKVKERTLSTKDKATSLKAELDVILSQYSAENLDEIITHKDELTHLSSDLSKKIEVLKQKREQLTEQRDLSLEICKNFNLLDQSRMRLDALQSKANYYNNLKIELVKNKSALEIMPFVKLLKDLEKDRVNAHKEYQFSKTDSVKAENELKNVQSQLEKLEQKKDVFAEKSEFLQKLNSALEDYEKLSLLRKEFSENDDLKSKLESEIVLCQREKNTAKSALSNNEKSYSQAVFQLSQREELNRKQNEINEISKITKTLSECEKKLCEINNKIDEVDAKVEKFTPEYIKLQNQKDQLFESYKNNLASTLSAGLEEGTPCPVCGSLHHVRLAENTGNTAEIDDIKALEARLEKAREYFSGCEKTKAGLDAEKKSICENIKQLNSNLSLLPTYSEQEILDVSDRLSKSNSAGEELKRLDQLKKELTDRLETAENRENLLKNRLSQTQSTLASLTAKIQFTQENIQKNGLDTSEDSRTIHEKAQKYALEISDYEKSLADANERLNFWNTKTIQLKNAENTAKTLCEKAENSYAQALEDTQKKLSENGFVSLQDYENFSVEKNEIARKESDINAYESSLCGEKKTFSELDKKLKNTEKPDISKLENEIEENTSDYDFAVSENAKISHDITKISQAIEKYNEIFAGYENVYSDFQRLNAFSRVLEGSNGVGLQRYVLGIMFEGVIFEANKILSEIKDGQFRLAVDREKQTSRQHKIGLELMVENKRVEKPYSVKYMSGGEKFLVALALSMALSTVVQMNAGGIRIDALLIDEGFGTLDSDTLDEAMEVLTNLSKNRRVTGIISHVDVLKEAIRKKICVTNGVNGSNLKVKFD